MNTETDSERYGVQKRDIITDTFRILVTLNAFICHMSLFFDSVLISTVPLFMGIAKSSLAEYESVQLR